MASPRSSSPPAPEAPLLVGQSLEIWREPAPGRPPLRASPQERESSARAQLALGAGALDLNAGAGGDLADELAGSARHLARLFPDVPLLLDCGDARALAVALERAAMGAPARPAPLVANSLRPGDPAAERLLRAAVRTGAGLVISPAGADRRDPPRPVRPLLALVEVAARRAREAGAEGPLFADALAYPPLRDPDRSRRSLELLRAFRDSPEGLIPLVAVGNVGVRGPARLRAAVRRLYAAAALGSGARALILPVEDRRLVAAISELTAAGPPGADPGPPGGALARELPWLRRVMRAAAGEQLPSPPPSLRGYGRQAWEILRA